MCIFLFKVNSKYAHIPYSWEINQKLDEHLHIEDLDEKIYKLENLIDLLNDQLDRIYFHQNLWREWDYFFIEKIKLLERRHNLSIKYDKIKLFNETIWKINLGKFYVG